MHTVLLLARCLYSLVAVQFGPQASAQGLDYSLASKLPAPVVDILRKAALRERSAQT